MTRQVDIKTLDRCERDGWKEWNSKKHEPEMSPEQCLEWLDGIRSFMFEVWRCNSELRNEYEAYKNSRS